MDKNNIFFGEKGLTITSANHIANMAKEYYQTIEKRLNTIGFYNEIIFRFGDETGHLLKKGWTISDLVELEEGYEKLIKYKSLIAWLREAIKAHEAMRNDVSGLNLDNYCSDNGITKPQCEPQEKSISEDDYIATLTIKERNRYYFLETACAVLGDLIHPNGLLSLSRDEMKQILATPNKITGSGRDAMLYKRKPTIPVEQVDLSFFALQAKYREYQAELNGIKNEIKTAVEKDGFEKLTAYRDRYRKYQAEIETLCIEMRKHQQEELRRIKKLKIIIPNDLMEAYNEISNLGKQALVGQEKD